MPGVGQALLDDLLCLGVVGRVARLDERDGLRQRRDVAREDSLDVFGRREVAPAAADEMGVDDRLVLDPFGDVQRRVVVHVGVLLLFKVVYLGEGHLY